MSPTLLRRLGLWHSVALELRCEVSVLTMLRHPAESVRSRQLAYGTASSPTTRTASWLNMMLGRWGYLADHFVHLPGAPECSKEDVIAFLKSRVQPVPWPAHEAELTATVSS